MIYGELGFFPFEIDIKLRMVSYWTRILSSKDTKLTNITYRILFKLQNEDNLKFSWIKHIKNIFDDTGF